MSDTAVATTSQVRFNISIRRWEDCDSWALRQKSSQIAPAPIVALLDQISDLEPDKVAAIARTLDQMSHFNDVVREHVADIRIGERYETITKAFTTIRDDAKSLVDQYADGKISTMERVGMSG